MISVQLRINQTIMIEYKACSFSVGKKRLNGRAGKSENKLAPIYTYIYTTEQE